jgi:hypothetical protein
MKLKMLITFAQTYSDMGLDIQQELDNLLEGRPSDLDIPFRKLIKEWLIQASEDFGDEEFSKEVAEFIEEYNK